MGNRTPRTSGQRHTLLAPSGRIKKREAGESGDHLVTGALDRKGADTDKRPQPRDSERTKGPSAPQRDSHLGSGRAKVTPDYLVVAKVARPRGLKGEVKARILTDFPERFSLLEEVYIGADLRRVRLEYSRLEGNFVVLKFAGYDDRTKAETLRGQLVQIPISEAMPLEEDVYYVHEIIGLAVWTSEGEFLGYVDDILFTGSNDVYIVKDKDREILIPAIRDVIREIDLQKGTITVTLLEGLR